MNIDMPLGITGGQSYLIVLAICGGAIGVLSFFTLVSIIRTLRAEGVQQFTSNDLIQVEGEERMGAADVAIPNVNTALARNIAEKMQTRKTPIQLTRRIAEKVQTREIPIPLKGSEKIARLNAPRSGINAALARSIAEKAQRARSVSERAQNVRPGDNSERVIPGIMVKTRTLSNLEDAKAIIQRKMKEQEGRTRSRGEADIADSMVIPREKVEEKLEKESFEGVQMPNEKEETLNNYDTLSVYYPQSSVKSGMGEAEGGPSSNSTDELMRRAAILDVKSLNTEFVELKESLVLLKTKLKDIQEKRKRYH